jgi:TRAP-type C4-dicarboxylate transport system permease small subunit
MTRFLRAIDTLTKATMVFAAFCAFGMAFLILTDVIARNTGHRFVGVPEYVRNTLIVIIFLQLPYAVRIRSMLAVDIFVSTLPQFIRAPLAAIGYLLGVAFFGALAAGAFGPAVDAWVKGEYEGEGVVEVAAWPARFAIVYGSALAAFHYAMRVVDVVGWRELRPASAEFPAAD